MGVPRSMLPTIRASSETYGTAKGVLAGIPVAGDLGDQQAALFGQTCFAVGEAKNTYGTGNFLLLNTGTKPVQSKNGLLTTLAYKMGSADATYCLEGSIAITGALVQWLRDNLGMIEKSSDIEVLAKTVDDNGGAYFVPAFSGLYAPYWKASARGVIAGLTRYVNKGHIARASLEATAWQTREIVDAMNADSGVALTSLKVDGGMVYNETLMQFQSDVLGVPVVRPTVAETTSLGAAYAAGLAVGFWAQVEDLRENWGKDKEWKPRHGQGRRRPRSTRSGRRRSRGPSTGRSDAAPRQMQQTEFVLRGSPAAPRARRRPGPRRSARDRTGESQHKGGPPWLARARNLKASPQRTTRARTPGLVCHRAGDDRAPSGARGRGRRLRERRGGSTRHTHEGSFAEGQEDDRPSSRASGEQGRLRRGSRGGAHASGLGSRTSR